MLKRSLLLGSILALSSCSYVFDKQIQDITVVTPGAEDAVCYLYVEGLRYRIFPPQTFSISKSYQDMTVDCLAPGNRRRKVVIEPTLSDHAPLNAANGIIPGTTWDFASNSLFTYPEVITIDFTGAPLVAEAPPAQNNPDIKQPEEYDLEEFTSGLPRLNSDRNAVRQELQRREKETPAVTYTESEITPHQGPGKPADKGDLKGVTDGLTTSAPKAAPVSATSKPIAPPPAAVAPAPEPAPPPPAVSAPAAPKPVTIAPYPLGPAKPSAAAAPAPEPVLTAPVEKSGPPIPLVPNQ